MIEPARVMLFLNDLNGGGAERVAVHLLNRLDPALLDVRMGLLRKAGPFVERAADPARIETGTVGVPFLQFEGHNSTIYRPDKLIAASVLGPANVRAWTRAWRPQVVMSFMKGMSVATYFGLRGLGAERPAWIAREGNNTDKVIEDELINPAGRAIMKGLTRRVYRGADVFLANSHEMAKGLARDLTLEPARLRVIHNPIDLDEVRAKAREPIAGAPRRPFLVAVGRLEYQKGYDIMLRAFAASKAARGCDLVILGKGSIRAELEKLARQLGVADRVRFVGFKANPWAWIARARLFVQTSRWEGFPTVVAETLACGTPALVAACPFGPAEIVQHGVNGWVVPPEDPVAVTAALDTLLADEALSARLGAAGPARSEAFGIDPMVEAYAELFLEQADRNSQSPPVAAKAGTRALS